MFLVKDIGGKPLASAIVFHVSAYVVQLIYWGDLPGHSKTRSMNFMAGKLFEYYKNQGKRIVDLGPAGEHSIPFFGLGEFKESMGCAINYKVGFSFKPK